MERVIGLNDVRSTVVMLGMPDGEANIELAKFYMPSDEKGIQYTLANTLGIRHIAFVVEDIEAVVAKLKRKARNFLVRYKTTKTHINHATFVGRRGLF